jgi:hypothetical protein
MDKITLHFDDLGYSIEIDLIAKFEAQIDVFEQAPPSLAERERARKWMGWAKDEGGDDRMTEVDSLGIAAVALHMTVTKRWGLDVVLTIPPDPGGGAAVMAYGIDGFAAFLAMLEKCFTVCAPMLTGD